MENYQSIPEQIINVLREINATNKDLSEALDIDENVIRSTINRMTKSGVVIHTGRFINKYKLYRLARPEELEKDTSCETVCETVEKKILIKMLLPFAKSGIEVDLLPSEQERIKKLFQDNYYASGIRKKNDKGRFNKM